MKNQITKADKKIPNKNLRTANPPNVFTEYALFLLVAIIVSDYWF